VDGPRGRGLRRRRNQAAPAEPPSPVATTQPADDPAATSAAETPSEATGTGPAATVPDEELETIVRAWSAALNGGDNEAAADLFAPGAIIVQAGVAIQLEDRAAAIRWNADLPCSGTIVDLDIRNGVVLAVFEFGDRSTGPCDAAPGKLAAAAFLIENGKIAVWQQVAPPETSRRAHRAGKRGLRGPRLGRFAPRDAAYNRG
jgi:hypothetical protein